MSPFSNQASTERGVSAAASNFLSGLLSLDLAGLDPTSTFVRQAIGRRKFETGKTFSAPSAGGGPFANSWRGTSVSFLTVNAQSLTKSKNGVKMLDFERLLEKFHWPALVLVTEFDGVAGKTNARDKLGEVICRRYDIEVTMRSTSIDDGPAMNRGKVGAGLCLLVHKRLQMSIRPLSLLFDGDNQHLLDGHLRRYRLDPKVLRPGTKYQHRPGAVRRPIILTCAYAPPASTPWGKKVRSAIFQTMAAMDEDDLQTRKHEDVFCLTMEHSNHPDGGVDLPLDYSSFGTREEIQRLLSEAKLPTTHRAKLDLRPDGTLMLLRCKSKNAPPLNIRPVREGASFSKAAALAGRVALAGVMGARQSDSWRPCKYCKRGVRGASCQRLNCGQMHSVHDQVRVPVDLVIQALTCPKGGGRFITHRTRRVWWTDAIDHAVTWGSLFIAPMAPGTPEDLSGDDEVIIQADAVFHKRHHFPRDLRDRTKELVAITEQTDELLETTGLLPGDDVNVLNDKICAVLRKATGPSAPRESTEPASIRAALEERRRSRHELHAVLNTQQGRGSIPLTEEQRAERKRVSKAFKKAEKHLESCRTAAMARSLSTFKRTSPEEYWDILKRQGKEHLSLALGLLDCQNDKKGRLISRNRSKNWKNAVANRRKTYTVRTDLGAAEDELEDALLFVSKMNAEICASPEGAMLSEDSYAKCSAADPAAPMRDINLRRGAQRDLAAAIKRLEDRRARGQLDPGERVRREHPDLVIKMNRDIDEDEVARIFAILKDVGPGTDGISPIVLRLQQSGHTKHEVTRLLNRVWLEGKLPDQWQEHRNLLHYKGKNTDPCCLDNYRGLGIDQCLLKVLSLVMLDRLESFLKETGGLSSAQGGFQRQRGTPESIFTLSETVRAAIQNGAVYLTFVDISGAYDGVLHPILWKKCIDRGICGRFLTTLQSIYHNASMVLELDNERSTPIAIECGVIQGNPLSPALFNIYIDDTIRAMQDHGRGDALPWGLPLPHVALRGSSAPLRSAVDRARCQDDHITSQFFADDGALLERTPARMQILLDVCQFQLALVGLLFNIPKTKWMVVAPMALAGNDNDKQAPLDNVAYAALKAEALRTPLRLNNQCIALVDYFDYLGAKISWRWNWQAAWREALKRANVELFTMKRGGLPNSGASMDALCDFVRGKVACHFNYVAAITGAGGCSSTAPWRGTEDIMTRALREVAGRGYADGAMLKIESGTWDQETRIDMLLLRFWCKLLTVDTASPLYRAMCLSVESMTHAQRQYPTSADNSVNRLHRQTWAQQLCAALERFQLPPLNSSDMRHHLLLLQSVNDQTGGDRHFSNAGLVVHPQNLAVGDRADQIAVLNDHFRGRPLRWVLADAIADDLTCDTEDYNWWRLPDGIDYQHAFYTWSPCMRQACFAALKRKGNARRQTLVETTLQSAIVSTRPGDPARQASRNRRYAMLKKASYQEPYWHLPNIEAARRTLWARLDIAQTRDVVLRSGRGHTVAGDKRQPDRALRPCYCCPAINGVDGVYHPETIDHVLLYCPAYDADRRRLRVAIKELAQDEATHRVEADERIGPPDLGDPARPLGSSGTVATTWLIIMKLCTGLNAVQRTAATAVPSLDTSSTTSNVGRGPTTRSNAAVQARELRAQDELAIDRSTADHTARWVAALSSDWLLYQRPAYSWPGAGKHPKSREKEQGPDGEEISPSSRPGFRLVTLVTAFTSNVFSKRRKLLRTSVDFQRRVRDAEASAELPSQLVMGRVGPDPSQNGPAHAGILQVPSTVSCGLTPATHGALVTGASCALGIPSDTSDSAVAGR